MFAKRATVWSRLALAASTALAVGAGCAAILVVLFPWEVEVSELESQRLSKYVTAWPANALEQEMLERKRMRRFNRQEQQRRLGVQLRRMEYLNIPLFDPFLDAGSQLARATRDAELEDYLPLDWPSLGTLRTLPAETGDADPVQYFPVFERHGLHFVESLRFNAGDELRLQIPVAPLRRNLTFTLFPFSPGNLRVTAGQNSWSRTYGEADVHVPQPVSIPINDTAATTVRIQSTTLQFQFILGMVSQLERNARASIDIAAQSPFWKADPSKTSRPDPEEENEESLALDPITETANLQRETAAGRSTALGYNLLLLQLPAFPADAFADPNLAKLMPRLTEFLRSAQDFGADFAFPTTAAALFQESIVPGLAHPSLLPSKLLAEILDRRREANLYGLFRNFGYAVAAFGEPPLFGYDPLAGGYPDAPRLDERYLEESDLALTRARQELDKRVSPVSGLEAIFPSDAGGETAAISGTDFQRLQPFARALGELAGAFPDWHANEVFLVNSRGLVLPSTVDAFQRWSRNQLQNRFLAHVALAFDEKNEEPSLRDVARLAARQKFTFLARLGRVREQALLVRLDRAIGQLLDALRARKVEHRTVIAIIAPTLERRTDANGADAAVGKVFVRLPGVASKRAPQRKELLPLGDALLSTAALVGIPVAQSLGSEPPLFPYGRVLEDAGAALSATRARNEGGRLHQLSIQPGRDRCAPFRWLARSPVLITSASRPVVELSTDGRSIEVFPCAQGSGQSVTVEWLQFEGDATETPHPLDPVSAKLGGHFAPSPAGGEIPLLFVGPKALLPSDLPAFLSTEDPAALASLFRFPSSWGPRQAEELLVTAAKAARGKIAPGASLAIYGIRPIGM